MEQPQLRIARVDEMADKQIVDVETNTGWGLTISRYFTEKRGFLFDARLTSPDGSQPYSLLLWPSVDAVLEAISSWLGNQNHASTATALCAMVAAELHE